MRTAAFVILASGFLLQGLAGPNADREAGPRDHSITVSIGGSTRFALPISVRVTYRNNGDKPWTFNTPTHSRGASIKYRIVGTDGIPHGYDIGHSEATVSYGRQGGRIVSMTAPIPKLRTLEPGQSYVLTVPVVGHVVPGNWEVWVKDGEQKLESNRFEFPVRFTRDSLTPCLEIASDAKTRASERKWYAAWLQKVMPSLKLKWWWNDSTPEETAKMEPGVNKELDAFRAFLKDPKNAEAIRQAIDRINREAGLPVKGGTGKQAGTEAARTGAE